MDTRPGRPGVVLPQRKQDVNEPRVRLGCEVDSVASVSAVTTPRNTGVLLVYSEPHGSAYKYFAKYKVLKLER